MEPTIGVSWWCHGASSTSSDGAVVGPPNPFRAELAGCRKGVAL
jgi:hypothetical protein